LNINLTKSGKYIIGAGRVREMIKLCCIVGSANGEVTARYEAGAC